MASSKLTFEILSRVDPTVIGPRLGRLLVKDRKDLATPNFLAVSSRGVVPHLTPDVILDSSEIGAVHLALEDCKSISITCMLPKLIAEQS